ncbi:MAG: P1 family peptidase [Burkholderiales bacterium]|nr:MAG: P1 family peptidase [Burkholderiales bacterium]
MAPLAGAITDVPGIAVGHFTDVRRPTGCTVILPTGARRGPAEPGPAQAAAGVAVHGAAPGTRETELLAPDNLVESVHAVLLAGGSAYGLDAASGVMRWLEARGRGFRAGGALVPIVPAAILFDLYSGDRAIRPDAGAGAAACDAASTEAPARGRVGAGAGAMVGKLWGIERAMAGGIGGASVRVGDFTVGAIVAVNAVGDVVDPASGTLVAGARSADRTALVGSTRALLAGEVPTLLRAGANTTIGCIATDAVLTKAQCQRLAKSGHDGLARAIDPAHTMLAGDTLFALATGASGRPADLSAMLSLCAAAAVVVTAAVLDAVQSP